MEGVLGVLTFGGLIMVILGYGAVIALGAVVLASIILLLGGVGMLLSTLVLSAVYRLKESFTRGRRRGHVLEQSH